MPSGHVPTALIVGASRGLGLGLAAGFAARGWRVIGTLRAGSGRTELHDLADKYPDLVAIKPIDITDADQIAALRERLSGRAINILFVNAGTAPAVPFALLDQVSDGEFAAVMATNVLGPMRVIDALKHLVPADGLIGAMSSGQGSIANNRNGGNDVYRASKAALNMLMQSLAARPEEASRAFLLLAPGWVRTDLGGDKAPYTVEDTVPLLIDILLAKRGRAGLEYLDRNGAPVPW